jgi:membrane associated rhomboid family serine protease
MNLLQQADRIPVTLLVALGYVTVFALTNMHGPDVKYGEMLYQYGSLTPLAAGNGESWRLLASAFLHGGLVHIGLNMMALLWIGPSLEIALGSLRFAVLYLVSAIGGSIAVCLLYDVYQPVVGGSGALFGMMGALLALNMRSGRHLFSFLDFDGPRRIVGLIVVNLVLSWLIPYVSNTAHIGGLLAGFLVIFLWIAPGRAPTSILRHWRLAITALYFGLLFWSIVPSTRFDHLWNRAVADSSEGGDALRQAAVMSYFGKAEVDDQGVTRLIKELRSMGLLK